MKKGLTLVEMIAIMSVFAIIVVISFPIVDGMIKKGNDDKYNLFLNDVYLATEAYVQKYIDNYPDLENGYIFVYMNELVNEKYIKSTLVNPKYCVNNECQAKQITTCDNNNCIVDDYTIIVGRGNDKLLHYLLEPGIINKVCIQGENCQVDSNTIKIVVDDDGIFKKAEV